MREARFAANREGDLGALAAVLRREASLLDPGSREGVLREAVRLARQVGDTVGVIEALEDLSRDANTAGRVGEAVGFLACIAELHRGRADRAGRLRAVMLAGRTLLEAWGPARELPEGMVLLLWAETEARRVDAPLAAMLKDYLTGFQYTLSDAEFATVEPWLLLDPAAVVDATLARYMHAFAERLP